MEALKNSWPAIAAIALVAGLLINVQSTLGERISDMDRNLSARIDLNTNLIRDLTAEARANREETTRELLTLSRVSPARPCESKTE